jgi:hypothetical protein
MHQSTSQRTKSALGHALLFCPLGPKERRPEGGSYQLSDEVGSLAGDREFRVSDPDRLTSHDDKTFGRDMRGLILRMVVVGFLTMLLWHTVIAAGTP